MIPQKAPRLKHLPKLKVKSTSRKTAGGPCGVALTNLLSCWASYTQGAPVCASLEQDLKTCMDARNNAKSNKSTINYHAARLKDKIAPPSYD